MLSSFCEIPTNKFYNSPLLSKCKTYSQLNNKLGCNSSCKLGSSVACNFKIETDRDRYIDSTVDLNNIYTWSRGQGFILMLQQLSFPNTKNSM